MLDGREVSELKLCDRRESGSSSRTRGEMHLKSLGGEMDTFRISRISGRSSVGDPSPPVLPKSSRPLNRPF